MKPCRVLETLPQRPAGCLLEFKPASHIQKYCQVCRLIVRRTQSRHRRRMKQGTYFRLDIKGERRKQLLNKPKFEYLGKRQTYSLYAQSKDVPAERLFIRGINEGRVVELSNFEWWKK